MRLFIAIRFDEKIINALTDLQECLKDCGLRGKCSPPEKLHLTLAFIGEYGSPDAVMDALTSVPFSSFPLRLDGLGNFGDLYWAGIADNPQLFGYVKRNNICHKHIVRTKRDHLSDLTFDIYRRLCDYRCI